MSRHQKCYFLHWNSQSLLPSGGGETSQGSGSGLDGYTGSREEQDTEKTPVTKIIQVILNAHVL